MEIKKHLYLDALRCFAILGVVLVHTWYSIPDYESVRFKGIFYNGQFGVQLFFLVSAFTLCNSLHQRQGTQGLSSFYLRRFFRIAPLFYLAILYYTCQQIYSSSFSDFYRSNPITGYFLNFSFLHAFTPYTINSLVPGGWSIGVECTFYLCLPFLFRKLDSINKIFSSLVVVIVINFLLIKFIGQNQYIQQRYRLDSFLYFNFLNQLPIFLLGLLWFRFTVEKMSLNKLNKWAVFCLCIGVLVQVSVAHIEFIPDHLLFGFFFLGTAVYLQSNPVKLIVNRLSVFMGKISYSIYIFHFAVIFWLERFGLLIQTNNKLADVGLNFLIILAVTVPLAWLSYQFLELPFIRLGGKIIERRKLRLATS